MNVYCEQPAAQQHCPWHDNGHCSWEDPREIEKRRLLEDVNNATLLGPCAQSGKPGERIRRCPSGHKLPERLFRSYVDFTNQKDEAIIFDCPGGRAGHTFTLARALSAGTFNEDEAARIRVGAADTVRNLEAI